MLTGRRRSLPAAALTTRGVNRGAPRLRRALNVLAAVCVTVLASPTFAAGDTRQVVLSSQTASLRVQRPLGTSPSAAVLVASGADGWRGVTSEIADRLSADGYVVIGLDTRSYLMEATRRSGALPSDAVGEDYLAVLRRVHEWFPDIHRVFLLGVAEGGGLALLAAADARVGAQLAGVVGVETPGTVSLRSPYWKWTSWITHKEPDDVVVAAVDHVAAVAPVPVAFIYGTYDIEAPDTAHQIFERAGEPRRLTIIGTERPLFHGARPSLFNAVRECLRWSLNLMQPSASHVSARETS